MNEKQPKDHVRSPGYYDRHACCPRCGKQSVETTTMGYILGTDRNLAKCNTRRCGWKGTRHEMVPPREPK